MKRMWMMVLALVIVLAGCVGMAPPTEEQLTRSAWATGYVSVGVVLHTPYVHEIDLAVALPVITAAREILEADPEAGATTIAGILTDVLERNTAGMTDADLALTRGALEHLIKAWGEAGTTSSPDAERARHIAAAYLRGVEDAIEVILRVPPE